MSLYFQHSFSSKLVAPEFHGDSLSFQGGVAARTMIGDTGSILFMQAFKFLSSQLEAYFTQHLLWNTASIINSNSDY